MNPQCPPSPATPAAANSDAPDFVREVVDRRTGV